jgi:pilus assembly protein Flp/PilA
MVRLLQAWLWLREKGQGLVEYALILVLIAVVVIAILALLGGQVSAVFSQIYSALGGQGGE